MTGGNIYNYPDPFQDSRLKDKPEYILQYVKAAWGDTRGFTPQPLINTSQSRMQEIKEYALGKQSVNKYKRQLLPAEQENNSWMSTDWTPPALLCKYREIAISKIVQREYDIQFFAVDSLAKTQMDDYYNQMYIKIKMREAAQQANSPLANSPILKQQEGEPEDVDALNMEVEYGWKNTMTMNAEIANSLVFQNSNISEQRKRTIENEVDFGIGGYAVTIDENGQVFDRAIDVENLVLSYCTKNDFSDLTYWGEIRELYVGDLAPYYTKDQLNNILRNVAGKYGNPSNFAFGTDLSTYWNKFKVLVLDFEFLDWDITYYKNEVDNRGNKRFNKTKFQMAVNNTGNLEFNATLQDTGYTGQAEPKFQNLQRKMIRKCSWVINTDFIHNYGVSENMIRKKSTWWDTQLNIKLYSWNFYKMKWSGITERLIPLADKASLTWFRLQNFTNKLIPYLISLDMNALESLNFGKGGAKATPEEITEFIFTNFVVPYRSNDLLSRNPAYSPVRIEATGQLAIFEVMYNDLQNSINMMRQVCGLNEATDGSTINSKNLNSTNDAMVESTNNALYLVMNADKELMQGIADMNVSKVQIAVKLGKVEGYTKSLGQSAVNFWQVDPDISNHEFGIFCEDAPTKEERAYLWQSLNQKEYAGLIEPEDRILIMTCRNLKQANRQLAYKLKKRKEAAQQFELQKQQQLTQGQAQASIQIEQAKQQTIQMTIQGQLQVANVEGMWQYKIEELKKAQDVNSATIQAHAKVIGNQILGDAKVEATKITAATQHNTKHIQGGYDLAMTEMDNQTAENIADKKEPTTGG